MRIQWLPWWTATALVLGACTPTAAPQLVVVHSTNASTEVDPVAEVPDDAMLELATTGINAGVLLGPLIARYSAVVSAYFAARTTYGKSSYRVLDITGWDFQNGWYVQRIDDGESTLRVQFEDAGGAPVTWDITLPTNYDPDLHPTFPTELTQVRCEIDKKLPNGGRMALSFFTPIGSDATATLEAYGSGSATLPDPLSQTSFEALNATFKAGADVDHGLIGLKSLTGTATLQFSGNFIKTGLDGTAKVIKNGHPAGDINFTSGQWQLTNTKGTFPIQ